METAIIAVIISSFLTIVVTVVNVVMSVMQKKQSDRLTIVTSGRIKYLDQIRSANADFVGRTEVPVIKYCAANVGDEQNYPVDISIAAANLKTFLKPFYRIEEKIITQVDELLQACLRQFAEPDADYSQKIEDLRRRYNKLYAQYDWAYWKYIQEQYDGRVLDSDSDFDAVYEQMQNTFTRSDYKSGYIWE